MCSEQTTGNVRWKKSHPKDSMLVTSTEKTQATLLLLKKTNVIQLGWRQRKSINTFQRLFFVCDSCNCNVLFWNSFTCYFAVCSHRALIDENQWCRFNSHILGLSATICIFFWHLTSFKIKELCRTQVVRQQNQQLCQWYVSRWKSHLQHQFSKQTM